MAIRTSSKSALSILFGLSLIGCDAPSASDEPTPGAAPAEETSADAEDPTTTDEGAGAEQAPAPSAGTGGTADQGDDSTGSETPEPAKYRNVKGAISEQGGHHPAVGLGGKGSLAAAVEVKVTALVGAAIDTTLDVAADLGVSAKLGVDGSFDLSLPADVKLAIVDAVDADGKIVGSVIAALDTSLDLDAVVKLAPITAETSLEVRVLRETLDCPCSTKGAGSAVSLALAVAAHVDARVSAAVEAALDLGLDLDVALSALAKGVLAAHEARLSAALDAGIDLDVDLMLKAELDALLGLQADLVACAGGVLGIADVTAHLQAALDAALKVAGCLDVNLRVRAHVAASLALSAALDAALSLVANLDLSAVLDAAVHASLCLEAQIAADAVVSLLHAAGAAQVDIDAAVKAGVKLVADISAAVDLEACVTARVKFVDTLCGKDGHVGLLGTVTGLVGGLLGTVTGLLGSLSANLDAALAVNVDAVVKAPICVTPSIALNADVQVDLALGALVGTLDQFCSDVDSQLSLHAAADVNVDLIAQVLATAELVARVK